MAHLNQPQRVQPRGLALIEMALVLPLLLLLTFGVMEYGWMFLKSQQIANAARQGARAGAPPDATATDINAAIDAALNAAGFTVGTYAITAAPTDPATLEPGEPLQVTVTVQYEDIELGLPLIPTPTTLQSSVTMAKEGP